MSLGSDRSVALSLPSDAVVTIPPMSGTPTVRRSSFKFANHGVWAASAAPGGTYEVRNNVVFNYRYCGRQGSQDLRLEISQN